jgi:hypothetical protein
VFDCIDGHGSFVRADKLTGGISMGEAFNQKYIHQDTPTQGSLSLFLPSVNYTKK